MPKPKAMTAAAVYDGKVFIFGGTYAQNTTASTDVDIYDPSTNSWDTFSALDLPIPLCHSFAFTIGDKIYVLGGMEYYTRNYDSKAPPNKALFIYDPINNLWDMADMEMPFLEFSYLLNGVEIEDSIYLFSIFPDGSFSSALVLDPTNENLEEISNHPPDKGFAGSSLLNGYIYMTGGISGGNAHKNVYRYDPSNRSWVSKKSLHKSKYWHGSAVIDQTLYIYGGLELFNTGSDFPEEIASKGTWYYQCGVDTLESWMPNENAWVNTEEDMPEILAAFSSVTVMDELSNTCIYTFGGATPKFFLDSEGKKSSSAVYKFCPNSLADIKTSDSGFELFQINPNPVDDRAIISFILTASENVQINIYDNQGKLVDQVLNKSLSTGEHKIEWNTENLAAGVYFCVLETKNKKEQLMFIVQ